MNAILKSCVVRFVGKQHEYVDINGRIDLVAGEKVVTGYATPLHFKSGPAGSDLVEVWDFVDVTELSTYEPVAKSVPSAELVQEAIVAVETSPFFHRMMI